MKNWTKEEIALLKELYPKTNKIEDILDKFPYRNKNSILDKAKKLKLNSNISYFWSKDDTQFLIDNYVNKGILYCVEKLNKTKTSIYGKIRKLGLSGQRKSKNGNRLYKDFDKYNINPEKFINIIDPEVAYFLGLLWADGYIDKRGIIRISCSSEDLNQLIIHFDKIGKWGYIKSKVNDNWKEQLLIFTCNSFLADFLYSMDYNIKSKASACKILNIIPDHLKYYWWRGYSDGDGCFYFNEKNKSLQYAMTSTNEQDWTFFEKILSLNKIKFTIKRISTEKSSSSVLRFCNKHGILYFGNYIYQNYENDNIGFKRKFHKFKEIENYYFKSI